MIEKALTRMGFQFRFLHLSVCARVRACARAQLFALILAAPAFAQPAPAPQVSVAIDPAGPVAVGSPVAVSITLLVPTYMPEPPVWPDLQIADAITRLPERATHPVTQRVGQESWSGIARTWEITPQRPADYDLGTPQVTITYADPITNAPVETALDIPGVAFTATVPPGAEGIDPFLAATSLTVTASLDGLPDAPKPGDAVTLTLTTTASGPPAMLLPPLADRLPDLPGLSAYPRQPALADGDPATRTEAIAYVIQAPGTYAIPALSFDWWNTASQTRETATTAPLTIDVPAPPGWHPPGTAGPSGRRAAILLALAAIAVAALLALVARRRAAPRPPSAAALRRALRRSARSDPPETVRRHLAAWLSALPAPPPPAAVAAIDTALRRLDRAAYGPPSASGPSDGRRDLAAAIDAARPPARTEAPPALPALNPALPRS